LSDLTGGTCSLLSIVHDSFELCKRDCIELSGLAATEKSVSEIM